jgi:hypothetical protein
MKTRRLVVYACILLLLIQVVPASAKPKTRYEASGTIDSYVDVQSSMVLSGSWSVKVDEDNLKFKGSYLEENIDPDIEQSPAGSIDSFTYSFTADGYGIEDDVLTFWGTLHVKKVWVQLDWKTSIRKWSLYTTITVTPDSIYIDGNPMVLEPEGQNWDRIGSTTEFSCTGDSTNFACYEQGSIDSITYTESPNEVSYEYSTHIYVYHSGGVDEIESVILETPNGLTAEMRNDVVWGGARDYYARYYVLMEDLPENMIGDFTITATDTAGNIVRYYYTEDIWCDVPVYDFHPRSGEHIAYGSVLSWDVDWGDDPPQIEGTYIGLWDSDDIQIWSVVYPGEETATYDGEPLEPGTYGYRIDYWFPGNDGEVHLKGHFIVDPMP